MSRPIAHLAQKIIAMETNENNINVIFHKRKFIVLGLYFCLSSG